MPIHTIGDSHCHNGWSGVFPHHLGPVLCYSFGREALARCDIRTFCKDGDTVVFCFGEIDCRCHIHKHVNHSYQTVIDGIVDRYFEAIRMVCQLKLKICVYNVVPPVRKQTTLENANFPFLGTDQERKTYVLYFNQKLKEKCGEYKYLFFDVYQNYVDENGFLKKELSDGSVHIQDGKYMADFIRKHL